MKTQAIKSEYRQQNRERTEVATAGVLGALAGHSAKYAIPVFKFEKDVNIMTDVIEAGIKNQIEGARADELKLIRAEIEQGAKKFPAEVVEMFTQSRADKKAMVLDDEKALAAAFKKLSDSSKPIAKEFLGRIDESAAEATVNAKNGAEALIKNSRPAALFMILTAAAFVSIVTLKNSLMRSQDSYIKDKENERHKLSELA